jgi:hypothetical protein
MYDVSIRWSSAEPHPPAEFQQTEVSRRPGSKRVPCKPTSHMLAAGARAGGVVPDIAWQIYRAMLDAAGFDSPETVFADRAGTARS